MTDAWWQALLAFAYGLAGSIVPVFNCEAYVVAGVTAGLGSPVLIGCSLAAGQGVGKLALFMAVREGKRIPGPWRRRLEHRDQSATEDGDQESASRWRQRWSTLVRRGMALVEHPTLGAIGMVSSGMVSIPPNFPTTILLATTRVNPLRFVCWLALGFAVRFVVIGYASTGVLAQFGITLR